MGKTERGGEELVGSAYAWSRMHMESLCGVSTKAVVFAERSPMANIFEIWREINWVLEY